MSRPDWRTARIGTRGRVALWLLSEVGAAGSFTKAQLRDAFPGVEQVDRRMRDLRAEGWVIATYREDRSLSSDELRLVTVGGHVWEAGYRSKRDPALSDKQRGDVLAADDYACRHCGISAGEVFPDDALRTAKLTVARVVANDGALQPQTLCDRCLASARGAKPDASLVPAIQNLDHNERDQLRSWIERGQRPRSEAERLWARYRRLPRAAQLEVKRSL